MRINISLAYTVPVNYEWTVGLNLEEIEILDRKYWWELHKFMIEYYIPKHEDFDNCFEFWEEDYLNSKKDYNLIDWSWVWCEEI